MKRVADGASLLHPATTTATPPSLDMATAANDANSDPSLATQQEPALPAGNIQPRDADLPHRVVVEAGGGGGSTPSSLGDDAGLDPDPLASPADDTDTAAIPATTNAAAAATSFATEEEEEEEEEAAAAAAELAESTAESHNFSKRKNAFSIII